MKRKRIHRKIFHLLLPAVVFFIPVYGKVLPPLIFLLFLNWLAEGSYIATFPLLFRERQRAALFSFAFLYLLYVAGMAWSSDFAYGWFDLEVKLSLLVFPLIFATREPFYLEKAETRRILLFFVAGCFASSLILLGHAACMMAVHHVGNEFYYTQLSWYFHPGYLAMYFTFAIAVAGYGVMKGDFPPRRFRFAGIMLLVHLFVVVVLLNSKAGWISLFMVALIFSFVLAVAKRQWLAGAVTLVASALLFLVCLSLFSGLDERVKQSGRDLQAMDTPGKDPKSTAERIAIWRSSVEIIRHHLPAGVGTGDVKDALMDRYRANNLDKIWNLRLDAHNQYLQTLIALGLPGLALLLWMLVFPAVRASGRRDLLYLVFLAVFALNILVESMFENQAGVIYYALFNVILFTAVEQDKIKI